MYYPPETLPLIEHDEAAKLLEIRPDRIAVFGLLRAYSVAPDVIGRTTISFDHIPGNPFDAGTVRYGQYETGWDGGLPSPHITIDPLIGLLANGGGADESQLNDTLCHELGHLVYDHSPATLAERRLIDAKNRLYAAFKLAMLAAMAHRLGLARAAGTGAGIYLLSNVVARQPAVNQLLYENKAGEDFARRFAHTHRTDDLLTVDRPGAITFIRSQPSQETAGDKKLKHDILLARALTPRARSLLRPPVSIAIRALQRTVADPGVEPLPIDIAAHRP